MTDFASFQHGAVTYPLDPSTARPSIRDLDPFVFYALEFYASVITTHLGARFAAESAGMSELVTGPVAMLMPFSPEAFLAEVHERLPLLALSRQTSVFEYMGQRKLSVDQLRLSYVLPPMQAQEMERMAPFLKAVAAIIDNRTEQGFDPAYTPTLPTGAPGEVVWGAARAGLSRVEVETIEYGGFQPAEDLFFPAVIIGIKAKERSEAVLAELQLFNGASNTLDLDAGDGTTVDEVVETSFGPPPTLASLSATTGTKAGGTPVQVNGAGFVFGRSYRVLFGGADASSVRVLSATALTCVTPQSAAYPTRTVDVFAIDQNEQLSNPLPSAFTFTTP